MIKKLFKIKKKAFNGVSSNREATEEVEDQQQACTFNINSSGISREGVENIYKQVEKCQGRYIWWWARTRILYRLDVQFLWVFSYINMFYDPKAADTIGIRVFSRAEDLCGGMALVGILSRLCPCPLLFAKNRQTYMYWGGEGRTNWTEGGGGAPLPPPFTVSSIW